MGTTSRVLVAAAAVVVAALGCSTDRHTPPAPEPPVFATTEAHVVVDAEQTFPVNLLFVADEDDPIWSEVSAVVLDAALDVTTFDVVAGDTTDHGRLGNLALTVTPPTDAGTATDVTVHLQDGTSRIFPIGSWTLAAAPAPGGRLLEVAEYVVAYPDTDTIGFTATNVSGEPVEVRSLDLGLASLAVAEVTANGSPLADGHGVPVGAGGEVSFVVRLLDDGEHDFHVTSPSVDLVGADGRPLHELFDPTTLGYTDITDAAFAQ